jgi:hypothetical protein
MISRTSDNQSWPDGVAIELETELHIFTHCLCGNIADFTTPADGAHLCRFCALTASLMGKKVEKL